MFSAATKTGSQPSAAANYIEDVFSTYLYTGNGSTQTITNDIDLAGEGGLVWLKARDTTTFNSLFDTNRGGDNRLVSSTTNAQSTYSGNVTSFNSDGFSIGDNTQTNQSGFNYASWTFRKAKKFFDVVTYTGTGSATTISHNLGSVPGMIFVKRTDSTGAWVVYSRGAGGGVNPETYNLVLNTTAAQNGSSTFWNSTAPTSSVFSIGSSTTVNAAGGTYVAYLFAHNAGGFGTSGTDNVISCGSFTTNGSGEATVNLGYEPQYLLVKATGSADQWAIVDVMRGFSQTQYNQLNANLSAAESTGSLWNPTASGFYYGIGAPSATYIYMAIRRPMKVPTDATTVFKPVTYTSSGSAANTVTTGFPVDLGISQLTNGYFAEWFDRLRGDSQSTYVKLRSASTAAEATGAGGLGFDNNTGYVDNYDWQNIGGGPYVYWNFARRPGFFDEVCYTGTGSATTFNHNLGVAPELMIVKCRSNAGLPWNVYNATIGATKRLRVNTTDAAQNSSDWNSTDPTSSVFSVGSFTGTNGSGQTHVAYLFATCPGVSKVGSYTGNGSTQAISCGFTGGARFVLIKRTDDVGDWYVYDTARGMTTLTDPYLLLNSTAAESVTLGSVTTTTGGFTVNASILAAINTSGASYIFLAIA